MSKISVRATCTVKDGKLEEFKNVAAACKATVAEKDTGTLQYDWFFNADETECVVLESYENSDAVMAHMGNLGDQLGALMAASDIAIEVYGTPSAQLSEAIAAFSPPIYKPL